MKLYETSDLGLTAALIEKGYSPYERKTKGKQVFFVFQKDEIVEGIINDYFNNRLEVDAMNYNSALKNVKRSIYELTD